MLLQITARDFEVTPALESYIRKRLEKINHLHDRINSCRIVLELPKKHHRPGRLYNVRIDLTMPEKRELVVTRKQDPDVYIAMRDAFNAIHKQLGEYSRKRHGRVQTHGELVHGVIARVIPAEGYGFINGKDGIEYYFSMTNIAYPQLSKLAVGDEVEFFAETLNDGWQAHHVVKERHRIAA